MSELSQQERNALADEFHAKMVEILGPREKQKASSGQAHTAIGQENPEIRKWLLDQIAIDARDRAAGLTPLPRSKQERLAMYYCLPKEKRDRLRHRALWQERDDLGFRAEQPPDR